METAVVEAKKLERDADGHLAHLYDWDESVAADLARESGIEELTENHWKVIHYMRSVFRREGEPPSIRRLTRESGVDTKTLYTLFPGGPAKKAARIAGLPRPKGCI